MIAVFTKFDALDDKAFESLEEEGVEWDIAVVRAPLRAAADFEKTHLERLINFRFPPKDYLYLRGGDDLHLSSSL